MPAPVQVGAYQFVEHLGRVAGREQCLAVDDPRCCGRLRSRQPEAKAPDAIGTRHRKQVHLGELLFRKHRSQTQVQIALGQVLIHHGKEVAVLIRRPSRWHQQRDRGLFDPAVQIAELVDRMFEQLAC